MNSSQQTKLALPIAPALQFINTPGFTSQIHWLNSKTGGDIVIPSSSHRVNDVRQIFMCLADVMRTIGAISITGFGNTDRVGKHKGATHIAKFQTVPGARKLSPWNCYGYNDYTRAVAFAGKFAGRVDCWFREWLNVELKIVSRCGLIRHLVETQQMDSLSHTERFLAEVVTTLYRGEEIDLVSSDSSLAKLFSRVASDETKGLSLIGYVLPEEKCLCEIPKEQIIMIRNVWADWSKLFALVSYDHWTHADWMNWDDQLCGTNMDTWINSNSEHNHRVVLMEALSFQKKYMDCLADCVKIKEHADTLTTSVLGNVFDNEDSHHIVTMGSRSQQQIDFDAITEFTPLLLNSDSGTDRNTLGTTRKILDIIIFSPPFLQDSFKSGEDAEFLTKISILPSTTLAEQALIRQGCFTEVGYPDTISSVSVPRSMFSEASYRGLSYGSFAHPFFLGIGKGFSVSPSNHLIFRLILNPLSSKQSDPQNIDSESQPPHNQQQNTLRIHSKFFDWTIVRILMSMYRFTHAWVPMVRWCGPSPLVYTKDDTFV